MDTRNGQLYESVAAAQAAGVPEEHIREVRDPRELADLEKLRGEMASLEAAVAAGG